LYLANWGTRRLMLRLPRGVLDEQTAGLYCHTDAASLIETAGHLIVSLYADRDLDGYWEGPGGQLAAMVPARSALAAGDLRLLYLGWPLAIQSDEVDDQDTEPPVPAGLGNLSAPLQAIADFLEIDQDLIAVAAAAAYARCLDALATRTEAAWQEAATLIETKKPRDYDLAVTLLQDLRALTDRQGGSAAFTTQFQELHAQHQRKPSLLDRFDKAGLPR